MRWLISLALAQQLKAVGLEWTPARHDFFAVPDRSMDERVFVITDMTVLMEKVHGQAAITFHGVAEWALDYVMLAEVIWLPTETQLRNCLERRLTSQRQPVLRLSSTVDGYCCEIEQDGRLLSFESFGASESYGQALLHLLQETRG